MKEPRSIEVIEAGFKYEVPVYAVTNDGIVDDAVQQINFCRGDKADEAKPRQVGVFVESLIEAVVHRLKTVNTGELATRETSTAITKLEEAQMWLGKRSADRKLRGVEQTYQK